MTTSKRRIRGSASAARALTAMMTGLAALGAASVASATELRYVATLPGSIVVTGNTLGLAKQLNANGPGVQDSIGTFISLSIFSVDDTPANPANPWSLGTTSDWTQNGSAAVLSLPGEGSQVLYAELLWGGGYNYVDNVTTHLNDAVTLEMGGASVSVTPDPATALTLAQMAMSGFAVNYYARSANVTTFVQAHGAGTYDVRAVPATQNEAINTLNAAGWTLVVAYRDSSQPIRNLSIFVGGSFVDENTQQDYVVSGFCTPPSGPIGGKAAISAIEGDANRTGDQLLIGTSAAGPFVNLSGPNNPADNFFCSQINDSNGNLDTSGTFGFVNHDAIGGTDVSGGRQGWDITQIPVSSAAGQLVAGQTSAVLRTITTDDSYVPTLAAFEIDVNAPNFTAGSSSIQTSLSTVTVGDQLVVTLTLDNTGQATATGVSLTMPVGSGLSLAGFTSDGTSGDASGHPVTTSDLAAGVDEGTLTAGQQRTVVAKLDVTGPPAGTSFLLQPSWGYGFVTCQGQPPLTEVYGQVALVGYQAPPGTGGSGGGTSSSTSATSSSSTSSSSVAAGSGGSGGVGGAGGGAGGGATSSSSGAGTSAGGSGGGVTIEKSGCGCATPGERETEAPLLGAGAVLMALAAVGRRRRRAG